MKKIGLIVNPVAGMGGAVGLKGTDGEMYYKSLDLGAGPVTPEQTKQLLSQIEKKDEIYFLTAPGKMGEDWVKLFPYPYSVIGDLNHKQTTADDTIRIARLILEQGAELLIFVGGDGTARDVYQVVGLNIPVIAVPAGVKIFSGVFAISAGAAAKLVDAFIEGTGSSEEEVLDIDEEAYRDNRLQSHLYGYMRTPRVHAYIQHSKSASAQSGSELEDQFAAAEWLVEQLKDDVLYLLGPGTTIKAITEVLSLSKTLLGVDALYNKQIIQSDLNEKAILDLLQIYTNANIVVTPIGGNGFIFGRGNKQLSAEIIRHVGIKNILIVSTPGKIGQLDQLRVDTHDRNLDEQMRGYRQVIVGYRESRMVKVV